MTYELIPLLPLASFLILGIFGHWIRDKAHLVAVPAIVLSLGISVLAFFDVAGGHHSTIRLYTWLTSGMAGLKRSSPRSLEASAKYFVLGAFSSGLLLYGISLLYGQSGGTKLSTIAGALGARGFDDPMLLIATILLTVGFGFKLAVVPFHMPRAQHGAPGLRQEEIPESD